MKLAILAVACLIGGCTSYEQRVANTCARLGAPMGSPHYWSCVQQQIATDQRDRAMWGGVAVSGAQMMQRQPQVVVVVVGY